MNIQYIFNSLLNIVARLRHNINAWDVKKPQYKIVISLGVFNPETNHFTTNISKNFKKTLNHAMSDYVDWSNKVGYTETHVYEYHHNKQLVETSVTFNNKDPTITHKTKNVCSTLNIISMGRIYDMQVQLVRYCDVVPPRVVDTVKQNRMEIVCNNSYGVDNGWRYVFSNSCSGKTRTEAELSDRMNNSSNRITIEFCPYKQTMNNVSDEKIVCDMITNIQSIYESDTIQECVLLELS